jgi:hypothetical protein
MTSHLIMGSGKLSRECFFGRRAREGFYMNLIRLLFVVLLLCGCKRSTSTDSATLNQGQNDSHVTKTIGELQDLVEGYRTASPEQCGSVPGAFYLGSNLCITNSAKLQEIKFVLFSFIEDEVSRYSSSECVQRNGRYQNNYCFIDLGSVGEIFRARVTSLSGQSMSLSRGDTVGGLSHLRFSRALRCSASYFSALFVEWMKCAKQGKKADIRCGKICIPDGKGGLAKCPCYSGDPDYFATVESSELWQRIDISREKCRGEFDHAYRLVWVPKDRKMGPFSEGKLYGNSCYAVWY